MVNGLAEVFGEWIRQFKVDGFRVDTAKHVDRAFFERWAPKILATARAAGVSDFEIFGEVFTTDAVELSSFVRDRAIPNVIDFPLQDSLVRYAGGSAGARGIATRLADDDYFRRAVGRRADARDLPRQPRHRPSRGEDPRAEPGRGRRARRARELSATASCTSSAARRPSTTATRSG